MTHREGRAMIVLDVKKIEKDSTGKFVFVCWQDKVKIWEMAIDEDLFKQGFLQRLFDSVIKPFIEEEMASEDEIQIEQTEQWLLLDDEENKENKEPSAEELNVALEAT